MNWLCAQIGAREHYAIPRALNRCGRLEGLYTDFWARPGLRKLWNVCAKLGLENGNGKAIGVLRSIMARWDLELEDKRGRRTSENPGIISWNGPALWWEFVKKVENKKRRSPYDGFIEVGRRFGARVREDLKRRKLPGNSVFFSYDTGALEAFEWCKEQGMPCVLGQMDPGRTEVDLVQAEEKQWPGWTLSPIAVPEEYFRRREREWELADVIVVNSDFSRRALAQQGVPPEKLAVIPLCFEKECESTDQKPVNNATLNRFQRPARGTADHPLRVLFLGQVILRKGIQYLLAAARKLERENIQFDVVGPIGISKEAMATAPKNLKFHGRADRLQTADWYRQADVFVLPTISDGFAITQIEAMAYGLPVVATPNCGDVVTDDLDGFAVPARDPAALAAVFERYLSKPELLRSQSAAALTKSRQFTLNHLTENLRRLEEDLAKRNL